jgi:hypothetical protein
VGAGYGILASVILAEIAPTVRKPLASTIATGASSDAVLLCCQVAEVKKRRLRFGAEKSVVKLMPLGGLCRAPNMNNDEPTLVSYGASECCVG